MEMIELGRNNFLELLLPLLQLRRSDDLLKELLRRERLGGHRSDWTWAGHKQPSRRSRLSKDIV